MIKKSLLFIVLIIPVFSFAQDAATLIENLKKDLKTKPDANKTATIYSDLTWYYSNISIDSALHYGNKALFASKSLGDSTLISQVYSDIGAVYFRKGDYANSELNYLNSYKIRKKRKDFNGVAKVNANLASIYLKRDNKKKALQTYLESINYFEKLGNKESVSLTQANVGELFHEIKNYESAKKYLFKAIKFQKENKYYVGLCTTYLTLGNVYLSLNELDNALLYYNESIRISKLAGNKIVISTALANISSLKQKQNKSKEVVNLLNKSKQIRDSIGINNEESIISLRFIKDKISHSKFKEAKIDLYKLKKIYENGFHNNKDLLETYQNLLETNAYLKFPDSVIFYYDKANNLQSKMLESKNILQINELETKYQTAKKEILIHEKEVEVNQKNNILIAVSITALSLIFIAFLLYRQQKLKNNQQEQEFQLESAIAKIETQDKLQEQRLTISRDLHDNIGAQLTFIISSVDNIKMAFDITNEKLDNKLSSISNFTQSTIYELRDTIWAMNNSEIGFEDLISRIYNFIENAKIATENILFNIQIDEDVKHKKLTSIEGMNIYRTIQEAINNAIKYSNASQISIDINTFSDKTKIIVKDNGIGYDQNTVIKGNGLKNMQKRMKSIDGKIEITSNINLGTTIILEII